MGYELHIVRKNNFDDFEEDSNISPEEWLALVEADPELELTNGYTINIPGVENKFQHIPGFSIWNAHPTLKGKDSPWLDYGFGSISAKYPDDYLIKKMISIAENLKGKVQGDDGEFYDESYFLPKENKVDSKSGQPKKSWWKFW
jgi:hypothetical protein